MYIVVDIQFKLWHMIDFLTQLNEIKMWCYNEVLKCISAGFKFDLNFQCFFKIQNIDLKFTLLQFVIYF